MDNPHPGRPQTPSGYGIQPEASEGMLPWSHVTERMTVARNYWVATTSPDGRPHVMPVWGVSLNEEFYFATDRASRKGRNLARLPALTVHLESGDDVVILEGQAGEVVDEEILRRFADAYEVKYDFRPEIGSGRGSVVFRLQTSKAFAWLESDFPRSATRWIFQQAD